jgi:hypothetical protein
MKSVKKEKKITIKFFLNQLIEPVTGEKGQPYYPLYIQVTHNRKNMQLKSKYGLYYRDLTEVEPGLLKFEERILRDIIAYETGQKSAEDDYDLKGLKRKYDVYSTSVWLALENYLKPKLRSAILKTNHELIAVLQFEQPQATVARLYKAAHLLFKDFDSYLPAKLKEELAAYNHYMPLDPQPVFTYTFPTVMDWVDGSYKMELEKKIKAAYKNKPEVIKKIILLVEQAVTEKLKQLGD